MSATHATTLGRALAAATASMMLAAGPSSGQVVIEWVTVGNPGNPPDGTLGAVGYEFRMGAYEVTNSQYAAFLNSVAKSDPYGLYHVFMDLDARSGITRSGSSGSYVYTVKANMANKPVNYVNWYDAARFCNWMTNGQGNAEQTGGTESGVYTFTGPTSVSVISRDLSDPRQVFLPTEDEWYKAAYHHPHDQGGDSDDYWYYAMPNRMSPRPAQATSTGEVANPGPEIVNYLNEADWNGVNGNVTSVGSATSTCFYGAFDLNGNVWEWIERLKTYPNGTSTRGIRGGSFVDAGTVLRSSFQSAWDANPLSEFPNYGFRVAAAPEVPPCFADLSADGQVDSQDLGLFISAFINQDADVADLTGDGQVDSGDVQVFITLFLSGCGD